MYKRVLSLVDFRSSVSASYALGPVDFDNIAEFTVVEPGREPFRLLVPALPVALLCDSAFREGAIAGYYCGEDLVPVLPTQVVNSVSVCFVEELLGGSSYAFTVGFLLSVLSALAEVDRLSACVGIAHLCFLVGLVSFDLSGNALRQAVYDAYFEHTRVVRAYRTRWQECKAQGFSTFEAACQALRGYVPGQWETAQEAGA